ncbi:hypothetical protein VTN49DRAFT_2447 [Thermomyces lanuginosus]|uniref:uncharacterized protein n=1 Tax=Thermomyces lanuginosus TaxID=5541 RepID=UPI003741EDEE
MKNPIKGLTFASKRGCRPSPICHLSGSWILCSSRFFTSGCLVGYQTSKIATATKANGKKNKTSRRHRSNRKAYRSASHDQHKTQLRIEEWLRIIIDMARPQSVMSVEPDPSGPVPSS